MIQRKGVFLAIFFVLLAAVLYYIDVQSQTLDMAFDNENAYFLKDGWAVTAAAYEGTVELPVNIKAKKGEMVVFTRKLEQMPGYVNSILVRTSQQFVKIYVGDDLILNYGANQQTPFEMEPCSAWQLCRLPEGWQEKTLKIELTSNFVPYTGMLNNVFIGSKSALIYMIARSAFKTLIGCLPVFLMGIFLIAAGVLFNKNQTWKKLVYLGVFSVLISLWIPLESKILQLVFGNLPLFFSLSFVLFSLIPPVFCCYLLSCHDFKGNALIEILFLLSLINIVIVQVLQFANIASYIETITSTHLIMLGIMISVAAIFLKKKIDKIPIFDGDVLIAFFVLAFSGLLDIIKFYIYPSEDDLFFFRIGIVCFVVIEGIQAILLALKEQEEMAQQKVLRQMVYEDSLTSLKNRTAFEEEMARYRFMEPKKYPIVMFADLNELKKINDNYGHTTGDLAIKEVAMRLEKYLGRVGKCFRIGGDEFFVISETASVEKFLELQELFLLDIEDYQKEIPYRLSISCGWYKSDPMDAKGIDTAIKIADERMYECKKRMKERMK